MVIARTAAPEGYASTWRSAFGLMLHSLESDGAGSIPRLALVPGLVTASRSMIPLARALVRRGMAVRIVDPPGFGYSDKPPRAQSPSEAAAFVAEWLRLCDARPVLIIGNSFGSQIATAAAAAHPGTASGLVLLSPTFDPRIRRWLSVLDAGRRPPRRSTPPTGRRRARLLVRLHQALGADPSLRMLNTAEYACASPPRALGTLHRAATEPVEPVLTRVQVPTLVIRADEDRLSSLSWAERLAALAPDGRFRSIPGAGHSAFATVPEAVADSIVAFCKSTGILAQERNRP